MTLAVVPTPVPIPDPLPPRHRKITGTSLQARLLAAACRTTVRPVLAATLQYLPPRLWPLALVDRFAGFPPRTTPDVLCEHVDLEHCAAEWVIDAAAAEATPADKVVLYLHGGAFLLGGLNTHRHLAAAISAQAAVPVLAVDYRMMPAVPVPTSVADGLSGYRHLLDLGYRPENITVMGDSAGGYLAFAVPLAAHRAGLPAPGAIVALSPLTTLDAGVKTRHPNARAGADPMFTGSMLEQFAAYTRAVTDRHADTNVPASSDIRAVDPAVDPAEAPEAELAALPRVLIQVGSTEILLADAELLTARLARARVPVELQVWQDQVHVFQSAVGFVPEARRAVVEIARFVWARPTAAAQPRPVTA